MIQYRDIIEAKELLGLPEPASMEEIKSNYRKLISKWHPDACNADINTRTEMTKKNYITRQKPSLLKKNPSSLETCFRLCLWRWQAAADLPGSNPISSPLPGLEACAVIRPCCRFRSGPNGILISSSKPPKSSWLMSPHVPRQRP